jgi:phage terminase large subunit
MMAKNEYRILTGYLPRPHQELLHLSLKRFNVIVCHRRFGKTVFSLNEMIDQAMRCSKKSPQYAYIAPTYGQAKRVAWDMLKDFTKNIPGYNPNEQDLKVELHRPALGDKIKIILLGAENPGSIRGIHLDGVILDEYAEMHPEVWSQVVRPALSDRQGWGIFIGTPKGYNNFYDVYKNAENQQDWFRAMYKASETKILPQSELDAARLVMTEEEYEQEYECSFGAALIGAYYAKQIKKAEDEKRISRVAYDKAVPVSTFWDLGIGDTTAIWFVQAVGREYHVIDFLESSGVGLDWYVKQLKDKEYIYDEHVLPHDAAARELGSGKSRQETLAGYGLGRMRILERHDVDDGIHASRMIFDKCWFDDQKCKRGLDALRAYERKWDSKNNIFSAKPLHNWASHPADAFRTFAMGCRGPGLRNYGRDLPRSADSDYDMFNVHGGS